MATFVVNAAADERVAWEMDEDGKVLRVQLFDNRGVWRDTLQLRLTERHLRGLEELLLDRLTTRDRERQAVEAAKGAQIERAPVGTWWAYCGYHGWREGPFTVESFALGALRHHNDEFHLDVAAEVNR